MTRGIAAAFAALLVAACADVPTAVPSRTPTIEVDAARAPLLQSNSNMTGVPVIAANDTVRGTFTVRPKRGELFVFGESRRGIKFPAKAICDPETSSYGLGTWDQPCTPTRRDIVVTVTTYYTRSGTLRLDFEPALRFNPATEGVYLFVDEPTSSLSSLTDLADLGGWLKKIYYCPSHGPCIDESLTDPSLKTFYDVKANILYRRIKHFSGYNVGVGLTDTGEAY